MHPDVVPYAQNDPLTDEQRAAVEQHLRECGECRDRVLFSRKVDATLRYEGRLSRVANALRITTEQLEHEIQIGTSVAELIHRLPDAPVSSPAQPAPPLVPAKK